MSRSFLDTNLLIYAYSDGEARQPRALELLAEGSVISVQCLNEFVSVATRKKMMPLELASNAAKIIAATAIHVVDVDLNIHLAGVELASRYKFSIYDAMIVSAALRAECDILYSEDMHHGLVVDDRLTITNPYRDW